MKGPAAFGASRVTGLERQQLLGELFHALSQPLTALRCSLELALHNRRSPGPSKQNLQLALRHAEQIARLSGGIRELLEADDPGDQRIAVSLENCLREVILDLTPLAESAQQKLLFHASGRCTVQAEPRRLRQALFYVVDSALSSVPPGGNVDIRVGESMGEARVELVTTADDSPAASRSSKFRNAGEQTDDLRADNHDRDLGCRLGLAIATRTFEAAGGRLYAVEDEAAMHLHLRMPLAVPQ